MDNMKDNMEMKWNENLGMAITIAFDMESHRPVVFIGGGKKVEGERGIKCPKTCTNPMELGKLYGAMVEAMVNVINLKVIEDMLMEL